MAKAKKVFVCTECGATAPKWMGKCPHCEQWNTFQEEVISKGGDMGLRSRKDWGDDRPAKGKAPQPVPIQEIVAGATHRNFTSDEEFNRVLGGGIVPGSIILIGGQPGIGKSTLLLQVALQSADKVLYISGEESEEQIYLRAQRIADVKSNCLVLTETDVSRILAHAQKAGPALVVIDSIQTLSSPFIESTPGSVSQIRECAGELQRFAKQTNIPVVLIGHITREGSIAGPKLLEHIVDVVLQFEGDQNFTYRLLRTQKNRFGSTDEMGIYEMQANGLREVSNPSELLLSQKEEDLSGSAIAATIERMRPMMLEAQALVSTAVYGTPQRSPTGFDLRRLNMLLAVLEKRGGFPFGQHDVFLNIAGGIRVEDPAIDLAVVSALISSLEDIAIPSDICFAGEVGLSGEIRAVNRLEQRIQEADRLGFQQIFVSKYNLKGLDADRYRIRVQPLAKLEELYRLLFE